MQEIWERIEAWLKTYTPQIMNNVYAGAAEEDIEQLEMKLGYQLPDDLRDSLRIHNGTASCFVDGWELLSVDRIWQEQQMQLEVLHDLQEEAGEIEEGERVWWWYPHWIPFASFGNGDLLCVEVDPSSGEQFGWIIEFYHEMYSLWIAPNFQAVLSAFADHLEMGEYTLDEFGGLRNKARRFDADHLPPGSQPIYL
jgi:cell wall assembly regulator SMI1